jgi:hypothetical protein
MRLITTQRESFVVRLSATPENDGASTRWLWRGEIVLTRTGQSWRFATLDDLPRILEALLQGQSNEDAK